MQSRLSLAFAILPFVKSATECFSIQLVMSSVSALMFHSHKQSFLQLNRRGQSLFSQNACVPSYLDFEKTLQSET